VTLVVDSSAIVALVLGEPDSDQLARALDSSDENLMSAATLVEATIVAEARLGVAGGTLVNRVVRDAHIAIVDVSAATAIEAIDGWRMFGKGVHSAALNFGDCFTYALARQRSAPVLCVGSDFALTDVRVIPGDDQHDQHDHDDH
jgi:ribonuclease VapC